MISETALSQVVQQKYISLVMENAPLCFLVVNKNRDVIYVNDYMLSFLKTEQGDPMGQKCYALCGYDKPCADCVLDQCVSTEQEIENYRSEVPRFNSIRYCDIVNVPIFDDDEKITDLFMEIVFDRTQEIDLEKKLEHDFDTMVDTLAYILSVQESEVSKHNEKIKTLAVQLGERMGLSREDIKDLRAAALLHNLGKISLYKARDQQKEEDVFEEQEPSYAASTADTLKRIDRMKGISHIIRYHLSHYDGSGDPEDCSGDDIPLASAILRLAIMISDFTPHVTDLTSLDAGTAGLLVQLFEARSGTVYSPAVVEKFRRAVGL